MNDDDSIPIRALSAINNMHLPLQIILIIVLIFLNAFFASAEIALLSFNEAKMTKSAEEGNKKSKAVLEFVKNSSKFLSTIQVGVTLAGFLSSAFAADSFADLIVKGLSGKIGIPDGAIRTVSIILITITLSFITLVFGELVPKRYAMKYSDRLARKAVKPLKFTGIIFAPFIFLLTVSVNGVLRLIGINPHETEEDVTEEEIKFMINEGQEQGVIDENESEMINNVFDFDDKTAGEIMTHRTEVVAVETDATLREILEIASSERYSRFPVYEESLDNIVGTIHIKDLLKVSNEPDFSVNKIMRPPCYIPESQKIDDVFKSLKESKNHMGIVLDEYGGTAGIITMEDILEEIVGNIQDEYDDEEESEKIIKTADDEYLIDGFTEIDEVNNELDTDIPIDEYDIMSGFVIGNLGYIPEEDEFPSFSYKNLDFTVVSHNNKIITKVKMKIHPKEDIDHDEEKEEEKDRDDE